MRKNKKQNSLAEETESDIHVRHLLKTLTEQCVSGIWDVLVAQDDSCYNVGHYAQTLTHTKKPSELHEVLRWLNL